MIEFDGYISGKAEKYFLKKSRNLGFGVIMISMLLVLPVIIFWGIKTENSFLVKLCLIIAPIVPSTLMFPKSKKEKMMILPQKIYIDQDSIVSVTAKDSDTRSVEDVKTVCDYGEFYDIKFPFGKASLGYGYVCQKDLLTKGSLEEFEKLFEGKIQKKTARSIRGCQSRKKADDSVSSDEK